MQNKGKTFSHLSWVKLQETEFCKRYGHTSTLIGQFLVTFGGHNGQNLLNDVVLYDFERNTWSQVEVCGDIPIARSFHTACSLDDSRIIVFGGHAGGQVFHQVHELRLKNLESGSPSVEWKIIPIQNGLYRYGHTAFEHEGNMYIFGGCNESKLPTSQIWMLDLDNQEWIKCETSGKTPNSRSFHMNILYQENLYIFGGKLNVAVKYNDIWKLDMKTMNWQEIKVRGWIPTPRYGFSATRDSSKIFIFGGDTDKGKTNQILIFEIERKSWQLIGLKGRQPQSRMYHTQVYYKEKNYIIGGAENIVKAVSDIWDLEPNHTFDITFEVEGQNFNVHKGFLAASCKYFEKMFSSKMLESQLDKIVMTDVKLKTFQNVLKFLYFEDFELDEDVACDLLIVSDKYLLPQLTNECEQFLIENLNEKNWFKILKETEYLECENLQKATQNFVRKNFKPVRLEVPQEIKTISQKKLGIDNDWGEGLKEKKGGFWKVVKKFISN